jgi:Acyl-CoA dehydrogenase, C-terminal domain
MGLAREAHIERLYRDARILTVPDGTAQIQRLVIGRELTGFSAVHSGLHPPAAGTSDCGGRPPEWSTKAMGDRLQSTVVKEKSGGLGDLRVGRTSVAHLGDAKGKCPLRASCPPVQGTRR